MLSSSAFPSASTAAREQPPRRPERFAAEVAAATGHHTVLYDERFSTVVAERAMIEGGRGVIGGGARATAWRRRCSCRATWMEGDEPRAGAIPPAAPAIAGRVPGSCGFSSGSASPLGLLLGAYVGVKWLAAEVSDVIASPPETTIVAGMPVELRGRAGGAGEPDRPRSRRGRRGGSAVGRSTGSVRDERASDRLQAGHLRPRDRHGPGDVLAILIEGPPLETLPAHRRRGADRGQDARVDRPPDRDRVRGTDDGRCSTGP